jgi:hypothetical protein
MFYTFEHYRGLLVDYGKLTCDWSWIVGTVLDEFFLVCFMHENSQEPAFLQVDIETRGWLTRMPSLWPPTFCCFDPVCSVQWFDIVMMVLKQFRCLLKSPLMMNDGSTWVSPMFWKQYTKFITTISVVMISAISE